MRKLKESVAVLLSAGMVLAQSSVGCAAEEGLACTGTDGTEEIALQEALEESGQDPFPADLSGNSVSYRIEEDGSITCFSDEEAGFDENAAVLTGEAENGGLVKLETPTAEWVTERRTIQTGPDRKDLGVPGDILTYRTKDSTNRYEFTCYREDGRIEYTVTAYLSATDKRDAFLEDFFLTEYHDSANYYFTVCAKGNGTTSQNSDLFTSDRWYFNSTGDRYAAPAKPAVNLTDHCFEYLIPEGAGGYKVSVFYAKTKGETPQAIGGTYYIAYENSKASQRLTYKVDDGLLQSHGEGYYSITAQTMSNDPERIQLSPFSEMSDAFYAGSDMLAVNQSLTDIEQNASGDTEEAKKDTIDSVKNIGAEKLRESMLVDNDNSGTNDLIRKIEDKLQVPVKTTVDEVQGMSVSSSDVRLTGASLNASDLNAGVSFHMGKPDKDVVVPGAYHSTVQVDFTLEGATYNGEKLAVPVKIVVPVPANIVPEKMRILHYHTSTDMYDEVITPYIFQEDGRWYASFVVDTFSPFVFGEDESSTGPVKDDTIKLVTRQKLDVKPLFSTSYARYAVKPAGFATVTPKGLFTAKKAGEVTVYGLVKNGNKWAEDTKNPVKVVIETPKPTSKTVTLTRFQQTYGALSNLTGTTIRPALFESAKPAVATIDRTSGLIMAVKNGTTRITLTYGEGKYAAKYNFTIKVLIPSMNRAAATMLTGANCNLKLRNTKQTVSWRSEDEAVAVVDQKGKVSALTAGTVKIIATVENVDYESTITVTPPEIRKATLVLGVKGAKKKAKVGLKKTKLKDIKWESSDTSVATVDDKGMVTAVAPGKAVIFTNAGGVENKCEVTVQ
ncbi:MAG: Ig-like domain-containing protein [Lachnospiraceae bacterium]|nr:Ig-like domain-containing protein [Lachnospiraceae bacterium]